MKILKKIFGGINMTWPKVIILAVIAGVYTALINQVPFLKETSFQDIAISFECWILFGILIIMNSKSNLDSALKCFVFFLISQPLIYLIEVPFLGWSIMGYYKNWIVWTILTLPMGYIGYYMKKDKWWGIIILAPMLLFLGLHASGFLSQTMLSFPHHLLSFIFCVVTMFMYALGIFTNKKAKIICVIISIIILVVAITINLSNNTTYNTVLLVNNGAEGIIFDDSYKVYLKDEKFGEVYIKYDEGLEDYIVNASFTKTGTTEFTIESPDGNKTTFEINIQSHTYQLNRK